MKNTRTEFCKSYVYKINYFFCNKEYVRASVYVSRNGRTCKAGCACRAGRESFIASVSSSLTWWMVSLYSRHDNYSTLAAWMRFAPPAPPVPRCTTGQVFVTNTYRYHQKCIKMIPNTWNTYKHIKIAVHSLKAYT